MDSHLVSSIAVLILLAKLPWMGWSIPVDVTNYGAAGGAKTDNLQVLNALEKNMDGKIIPFGAAAIGDENGSPSSGDVSRIQVLSRTPVAPPSKDGNGSRHHAIPSLDQVLGIKLPQTDPVAPPIDDGNGSRHHSVPTEGDTNDIAHVSRIQALRTPVAPPIDDGNGSRHHSVPTNGVANDIADVSRIQVLRTPVAPPAKDGNRSRHHTIPPLDQVL